MFEDNVLERNELVLEDFESSQSVPASHEPSVKSDKQDTTARAPSTHQTPAAKEPASPVQPEPDQPQRLGWHEPQPFAVQRRLIARYWPAAAPFTAVPFTDTRACVVQPGIRRNSVKSEVCAGDTVRSTSPCKAAGML